MTMNAKSNHRFGAALILMAKVWFIVAGYGIYVGLSRILGVEGFGRYGLITAAITVINMCFIRGTLQAVSKFVSEDASQAAAVRSQALRVQLWLGGGSFVIFFGLSGIIARLLQDPTLAPYLRLAAFTILFYSWYAVFIGVLNGRKEFTAQALLDIAYSALKLALVLILAWFFGLKGAAAGLALAAGGVLAISTLVVRAGNGGARFPARKIIAFFLPAMAFTFMLHWIMYQDMFLLKAFSPMAESARYTGWYTAVLTVARLPYLIVVSALSLVIFPFVSHSTHREDRQNTTRYIRRGMRLTYLLMLPATILISSSPRATLGLIYQQDYYGGAPALAWVCAAYLCFSFFAVSLNVISGSGWPLHSLILALSVAVAQLAALVVLVPRFAILGAAWGSAAAFLLGAGAGAVYIVLRLGAFIEPRAFIRITLAGLITFGLSVLVPAAGLGLFVKDAALAIVFVLLLMAMREVGSVELRLLLSVLPRRGGR